MHDFLKPSQIYQKYRVKKYNSAVGEQNVDIHICTHIQPGKR